MAKAKTVALPVPDVGAAQEAIGEALGEMIRVETAALVGGVLAVPIAEKAAYTSFRAVFGNSGEGLSDNERFARQLFRFGLGLLGAYLSATGRKPETRALGTGLMAEATVSLLKGFGLAIV